MGLPGRRDCESALEPVIRCARLLPSGMDFSLRGRDDRFASFVDTHHDRMFVAHSATAAMKYLIRLGIEPPVSRFDTVM